MFKFHQCEQKADESIDSYCIRQIITKGNYQIPRIRALSEEITLENLPSVGRSLEVSEQQAKERTVTVDTSVSTIRRYTRKQMNIRRKGEQCYTCGGNFHIKTVAHLKEKSVTSVAR